jgi:hypothetical protein
MLNIEGGWFLLHYHEFKGLFMNKMAVNSLLAVVFASIVSTASGAFYVAPTGSDNAAGTQTTPLKSIAAAIGKVNPGDTVYVRAGTYSSSSTITISASGASSIKSCLMVFPGDARSLLDFSGMSAGNSNRGILLKGNYWYIRGLIIKAAGDNGMNISGSNNVVEFCDFTENQDAGFCAYDL